MKSQTPAEGILLRRDLGYTKTYHVECTCTDPDHTHFIDITSDEDDAVVVNIYTFASIKRSASRWKLIWQLLTKRRIEYYSDIYLSQQQALNYADTIKLAIEDVKNYKRNK